VIFLFSLGGAIKTPEEAADYQNVFICVEMLIAAFAHLYAFPYKEYAEVNVGRQTAPWNSLFHALNLTDVVHDTMHQVGILDHPHKGFGYSHTSDSVFLFLPFTILYVYRVANLFGLVDSSDCDELANCGD
jgi:hypothetical protein